MQFNGFSKQGTKFLENLSLNNKKQWFEENRAIWEEHIRLRCELFVHELGETLQILVPSIKFKPKVGASLFRIYRDVRFSKDKTPMKSKIGILFWQGTGHRMQSSSFYIHFDKSHYFIASGIRNFKQPMLNTFREYLQDADNRTELQQIMQNLEKKGYKFPEKKFIRYPRNCDKNDTNSNLYLYGAMYAYKDFILDETFYNFDIATLCFDIYTELFDLHNWVYKMTLTHTK